jgi:hypothetical protein
MVILFAKEGVLDKCAIVGYAGQYLSKHKQVDAISLQRYIMNRDKVGKAISVEDIEFSLEMLYYGEFLKLLNNSGHGAIYEREFQPNAKL